MENKIHTAIKAGHGDAILYATAIGLLLSDVIPTPADALYFYTQRKLKEKLEAGIISPAKYWTLDAIAYYGYNPVWWGVFLSVLVATKGDYVKKAKVGVALLASGIVLAVLHNNIQRDESK